MNRKYLLICLTCSLIMLMTASVVMAGDLVKNNPLEVPRTKTTTAFTYQGYLTEDGSSASGAYDLRFSLFDAESSGSQVGETLPFENMDLIDGYFNVLLDFGDVFDGNALWLEVRVRPGDSSGGFTTLSPLQEITAAPYALYSQRAPWSGITGVPSDFADGVDNDTTSFWSLDGNANTNGTNFLGTLNNQALMLRVNATNALRLEPTSGTPNLIGGYGGNDITVGVYGAVIAGGGESGKVNKVTDHYGTVGGGLGNLAGDNTGTVVDAGYSTVCGGSYNQATGDSSFVGGGEKNTASGYYSTIPGGYNNEAVGDYSFAAGQEAHANHDGSFVWSDIYTDTAFTSDRNNQFKVRASGGSRFENGVGGWIEFNHWDPINTFSGAYLSHAGVWTNVSDRNKKENFEIVNHREILKQLADLPILSWNFKVEDDTVRHIGPVSQDFNQAFQLGDSDTSIGTIDADGIALASAQGLYQLFQEQKTEIRDLKAENAAMQEHLQYLEIRLRNVENNRHTPATSTNSVWLIPVMVIAGIATIFQVKRIRAA